MSRRSTFFGSFSAMLLGASLAGCGDTPPAPPPSTGQMEGSMEKGKMAGPMEPGKMEGGAMESGKMEPGKMESGKMEPGKMESGKMDGVPK